MHLVDIIFYSDCNVKLCQNRKRINCNQGQDPQSASGSLTLGPFPAFPPPICSFPTGAPISQWAIQIFNGTDYCGLCAVTLRVNISDMQSFNLTQCWTGCYLLNVIYFQLWHLGLWFALHLSTHKAAWQVAYMCSCRPVGKILLIFSIHFP